jgi:hypothetical protein
MPFGRWITLYVRESFLANAFERVLDVRVVRMIFQRHPIGKSPLQEDVDQSQAREAGVKGALEVKEALEHRTMIQSLGTIPEVNHGLRRRFDFMHSHESVSQQASKDQRPGRAFDTLLDKLRAGILAILAHQVRRI